MNKENTICLTRHRPKGLPWGYNENSNSCLKFKEDLEHLLRTFIIVGYKKFLIGMAEGVDMISAEILLNLKKEFSNIEIIAVIPCRNQEIKWSLEQQNRYKRIIDNCDNALYLNDEYTPSCMNDRNLFMVQSSSCVLAVYNGKPSGTRNTIKYAVENGNTIITISTNRYK